MALLNFRQLFPAVGSCMKLYVCPKRNFRMSAVHCVGAYEGDGQTTVSVINNDFKLGLLIDTVNESGFRLNNGSQIIGPLAVFNKALFSWNVASDMDISKESLSLFVHLEPKLDILLVGLSDFQANQTKLIPVIQEIKKFCNIEVLPTERAIAAFNFLVSEGRVVGAALLPPAKITFTDDDHQQSRLRRQEIYDIDPLKSEFL